MDDVGKQHRHLLVLGRLSPSRRSVTADASRVATWLRCEVLAAWSPLRCSQRGVCGKSQITSALVAHVGLFRHAAADDLIESVRHGRSMLTGSGRGQGQMPGDLLLHALARIGLIACEALI